MLLYHFHFLCVCVFVLQLMNRLLDLRCLRFDKEVVGRLYLIGSLGHDAYVRVIDSCWDSCSSSTKVSSPLAVCTKINPRSEHMFLFSFSHHMNSFGLQDSSVAVIDGAQVLLTPVARATVPPPMSMYRAPLPTNARYN